MTGAKLCGKCRIVRPFDEFARDRSRDNIDGLQSWCKHCNRDYRAANRDKMRQYSNRYYATKGRDKRLQKEYGVDQRWYEASYIKQSGKCRICSEWFSQLVVDHDHRTGTVRELLCQNCNKHLGIIEREEWLSAAMDYLRRHGMQS